MIERVRCRGEKLLLPLPLHCAGEEEAQNGTVSCSLPFFFDILFIYFYFFCIFSFLVW
jgi:hypothetical protein